MSGQEFRPSAGSPIGGPHAGDVIAANCPRNEWWVVATREEITREPLQRWALDFPVMLYRREKRQPGCT